MNIPLSPRLKTCAGFVCPGDRVADIGCDHGHLGIWLLHNGVASHVIASDVRPGPLQCAKNNAQKFGITDQMDFFLCDGVSGIPRDFDTLLCAGMGAETMISILDAAPWLKCPSYRLVLQCQSKTPVLRNYLSQNGWRITEESVIRDGRFLYTVMEVSWQPGYPVLSPGECYFPPALLENPGKETVAYYHRVLQKLRLAVTGKQAAQGSPLARILAEVEALQHTPDLSFLKEEAP